MNHEDFFQTIAISLNTAHLKYVQKAYWMAKEVHRTQSRRLTGERYFEHVRRVAELAIQFGFVDHEVIALSILHDTIEDTYTPQDVIVDLFGTKMYSWILSLSKEVPVFHPVTGKVIHRLKLKTEEYYRDLSNGNWQPKIVKAFDRLDNVSDLILWDPQRQAKYVKETREFVLPLAQTVDERIAQAIESKLNLVVSV